MNSDSPTEPVSLPPHSHQTGDSPDEVFLVTTAMQTLLQTLGPEVVRLRSALAAKSDPSLDESIMSSLAERLPSEEVNLDGSLVPAAVADELLHSLETTERRNHDLEEELKVSKSELEALRKAHAAVAVPESGAAVFSCDLADLQIPDLGVSADHPKCSLCMMDVSAEEHAATEGGAICAHPGCALCTSCDRCGNEGIPIPLLELHRRSPSLCQPPSSSADGVDADAPCPVCETCDTTFKSTTELEAHRSLPPSWCLPRHALSVASRCPLCHTDIRPGLPGWRAHLLTERCSGNPHHYHLPEPAEQALKQMRRQQRQAEGELQRLAEVEERLSHAVAQSRDHESGLQQSVEDQRRRDRLEWTKRERDLRAAVELECAVAHEKVESALKKRVEELEAHRDGELETIQQRHAEVVTGRDDVIADLKAHFKSSEASLSALSAAVENTKANFDARLKAEVLKMKDAKKQQIQALFLKSRAKFIATIDEKNAELEQVGRDKTVLTVQLRQLKAELEQAHERVTSLEAMRVELEGRNSAMRQKLRDAPPSAPKMPLDGATARLELRQLRQENVDLNDRSRALRRLLERERSKSRFNAEQNYRQFVRAKERERIISIYTRLKAHYHSLLADQKQQIAALRRRLSRATEGAVRQSLLLSSSRLASDGSEDVGSTPSSFLSDGDEVEPTVLFSSARKPSTSTRPAGSGRVPRSRRGAPEDPSGAGGRTTMRREKKAAASASIPSASSARMNPRFAARDDMTYSARKRHRTLEATIRKLEQSVSKLEASFGGDDILREDFFHNGEVDEGEAGSVSE